ncbi:ubiquinone anaerobic biosynthesis accessory factor UbiT [Ignatzschineria sp. LJL83]
MNIPTRITQKIPEFMPPFCKYHLKIMPNWLKLKAISLALNHFFKSSIEEGDLDFLEDKHFLIEVLDLDYAVKITLQDGKLIVITDPNMPADVTLKSTFNPLILMISRREDPDTLFFNRTLSLEGNTALGLEIKNWLDSLDLDLLPKPIQSTLQQYSQLI